MPFVAGTTSEQTAEDLGMGPVPPLSFELLPLPPSLWELPGRTHLGKQWPLDTSHWVSMRTAPQKCEPRYSRLACHGHWPASVSWPLYTSPTAFGFPHTVETPYPVRDTGGSRMPSQEGPSFTSRVQSPRTKDKRPGPNHQRLLWPLVERSLVGPDGQVAGFVRMRTRGLGRTGQG